MSTKMIFAAAIIAGAVNTAQAQEPTGCDKPTCQPDHDYSVQMVPHKDIIHFDRREIVTNGKTYITDGQNNKFSEDNIKIRGFRQSSYTFVLPQADFEAAVKKGQVNVTLDPVYEAAPDDQRACMSVPVKDVAALVDGGKGTATLRFTLDENMTMNGKRNNILDELDKKPKAEQVWCYSLSFGK